MSWTTASIKLCDDQTQTKDAYLNKLSVRGGPICIGWLLSIIRMVQIAILLSLSLFPSPFHEESSTLYSFFWIIFTLHMLIIWTLTWVLVPSTTFLNSLWVALAKVALFRLPFHINVASKVAVVQLIRWCQPSLRYFRVFFLLPCPWSTFLSLNLLGRSL